MIEAFLLKRNVHLTEKGRRWADNADGVIIALFFIGVMLITGFIEGYGNH